jgi:hypothetical protein
MGATQSLCFTSRGWRDGGWRLLGALGITKNNYHSEEHPGPTASSLELQATTTYRDAVNKSRHLVHELPVRRVIVEGSSQLEAVGPGRSSLEQFVLLDSCVSLAQPL